MNTKQRDVVLGRWSAAIQREARDLAMLRQIATRALADPEVNSDPTLQSMIRADLEKRRAEIEQELQAKQARVTSPPEEQQPPPPEPTPTTPPEQVREEFNRVAQTLCESLEHGDEDETRAIFGTMRALQEHNPGVIPSTVIGEYKQRVDKLRLHIKQLKDQIAALTQQAISASRGGIARDLSRAMRRLTAIHAAHPHLLDEPGLEEIRCDVADAADERRDDQVTIKKLLERERAITAQIETLAAAVRDFHQVACTAPDSSEEFRKAETTYLRAIQKVRTYGPEWFSGVVLELADLLAEWSVPPLGAESHIDRFLDGINTGLRSIRTEMREIESEQDSSPGTGSAAAVPEP